MGAKSQKRNINTQIIFTMMGLLILCVFFSITTKSFLTQRNLLNIATQTSVAVIVAIAETYIIASGCIDLSVGSGVAFSGLVGLGHESGNTGSGCHADGTWDGYGIGGI